MIRHLPQRPLELPVHSPVRGRAYHDGDDLHRAMADCIVKPLRLPDTLRAVHAIADRVHRGRTRRRPVPVRAARRPRRAALAPLRDRPRHGRTGKAAPGVTPGEGR